MPTVTMPPAVTVPPDATAPALGGPQPGGGLPARTSGPADPRPAEPDGFPAVLAPSVPAGQPNVSDTADDPFGHLFEKPAREPAGQDGTHLAAPAGRGSGRAGSGQPPRRDRNHASPAPARPGRKKLIVTVATAVVVLAAGGGVAAWAATRHPGHPSAHASHPARVPVAATAQATPTVTPPTSPPAATPTPASTGLVTAAPGVPQQGNELAVVAFLNAYFRAINNHNYQQYGRLLDTQLQQGETAAQFRSGYRSTKDSRATLTALASLGAQTAASVTFTSHQLAADSPTRTGCTHWNITLYLNPQGSSYVIGTSPSSYHASYQAC
jgi:hypothetical protein